MPAPVAAPRRAQRLGSINTPSGPRPVPKKKPEVPKCCDEPDPVDEDGAKVCANCGVQLAVSNIVADVTFQEDSRGAAQVQGGFIGEKARHANTLGAGAFRRIGGGERNASQEIENNGRRILQSMCPRLNVPDATRDAAQLLFIIAAGNGFNAGRRSEEVVAACLYMACRRRKENTVLLMDISEIVKVNVFRLGEVYKDLKKTLHINDPEAIGVQQLVEVEPLIEKFCRKLEFGEKTRVVAEDAVKIIKRMKRDWMVSGRHPAGLCGACIILAARMNNFRRSVREVVYIAKVAGVTIHQRLEEFKRTRSAALTVDQFREFAPRLKYQHDPPVLAKTAREQEKWEEKKRKRQEHNTQRETMERERQSRERSAIEIPDDNDDASSRATSAAPEANEEGDTQPQSKRQRVNGPLPTPASTQEPRFDAEGFAIPALPIPVDPAITGEQPAITNDAQEAGQETGQEANPPKRKRGRPRKEKPEPVQITEEELTAEQEIEDEIDEALNDQELMDSLTDLERTKNEERAKALAEQEKQRAAEQNHERREATGVNWWQAREAWERGTDEVVTEADLEAEFANDPEVMNCKLSDQESRIKEQIWVAHNEDWLRSQHEKQLIKQIAEASGAGKKDNRRKTRKKKGRMGDGSVLLEAETPIETPADANLAMLKKRAAPNISKFIDYERLAAVYGDRSSPAASSTSQSRAESEAPGNPPSRAASNAPDAQAGADGAATPMQQWDPAAFGMQSPEPTQQNANDPKAPANQDQPAEGGEEDDADEDDGDEGDDPRSSPPVSNVDGYDDYQSDQGEGGYNDDDDYERAVDEASFGFNDGGYF
ncbi:hypothetical protein KC368_g13845 [Hortaea werneckii]|nr:hypothetical protein KC368_g13845 [Hortaea werneckii]